MLTHLQQVVICTSSVSGPAHNLTDSLLLANSAPLDHCAGDFVLHSGLGLGSCCCLCCTGGSQKDMRPPEVVRLQLYQRMNSTFNFQFQLIYDFHLALLVAQVIRLAELGPLKDSLVGLPGASGLSVEQRKRLTIAVELVANPSKHSLGYDTAASSEKWSNQSRSDAQEGYFLAQQDSSRGIVMIEEPMQLI